MDSATKLRKLEEIQQINEEIKELNLSECKKLKALVNKKERLFIEINS